MTAAVPNLPRTRPTQGRLPSPPDIVPVESTTPSPKIADTLGAQSASTETPLAKLTGDDVRKTPRQTSRRNGVDVRLAQALGTTVEALAAERRQRIGAACEQIRQLPMDLRHAVIDDVDCGQTYFEGPRLSEAAHAARLEQIAALLNDNTLSLPGVEAYLGLLTDPAPVKDKDLRYAAKFVNDPMSEVNYLRAVIRKAVAPIAAEIVQEAAQEMGILDQMIPIGMLHLDQNKVYAQMPFARSEFGAQEIVSGIIRRKGIEGLLAKIGVLK